MRTDLNSFCLTPDRSIREVMACMDAQHLGIVLVTTNDGRLRGTVTDGDLRRAVLADLNLDEPVEMLLARKAGTAYARPITALAHSSLAERIEILQAHSILHVPIVSEDGLVVGLVTRDDCFVDDIPLHAVIMAGGAGSRLMPLTRETPKPMLPVGDRPLLEIIVGQLRDAGVKRVHVTTHHWPEKIRSHFGNGTEFGVEMSYVTEDKPLGTAGALALMERPPHTMLVVNGDILTGLDARRILAFHLEQRADLTVAVRQYDIQLPYGVIECDGPMLKKLTEKPVEKVFVNAGIYLLEPGVHELIPRGERFDMTDLIQKLLHLGRPVCCFPIREYWLDIGQQEDYERANARIRELKASE